jgi:hypothetical protein
MEKGKRPHVKKRYSILLETLGLIIDLMHGPYFSKAYVGLLWTKALH